MLARDFEKPVRLCRQAGDLLVYLASFGFILTSVSGQKLLLELPKIVPHLAELGVVIGVSEARIMTVHKARDELPLVRRGGEIGRQQNRMSGSSSLPLRGLLAISKVANGQKRAKLRVKGLVC